METIKIKYFTDDIENSIISMENPIGSIYVHLRK